MYHKYYNFDSYVNNIQFKLNYFTKAKSSYFENKQKLTLLQSNITILCPNNKICF